MGFQIGAGIFYSRLISAIGNTRQELLGRLRDETSIYCKPTYMRTIMAV